MDSWRLKYPSLPVVRIALGDALQNAQHMLTPSAPRIALSAMVAEWRSKSIKDN
jgi:hypothetical protein